MALTLGPKGPPPPTCVELTGGRGRRRLRGIDPGCGTFYFFLRYPTGNRGRALEKVFLKPFAQAPGGPAGTPGGEQVASLVLLAKHDGVVRAFDRSPPWPWVCQVASGAPGAPRRYRTGTSDLVRRGSIKNNRYSPFTPKPPAYSTTPANSPSGYGDIITIRGRFGPDCGATGQCRWGVHRCCQLFGQRLTDLARRPRPNHPDNLIPLSCQEFSHGLFRSSRTLSGELIDSWAFGRYK